MSTPTITRRDAIFRAGAVALISTPVVSLLPDPAKADVTSSLRYFLGPDEAATEAIALGGGYSLPLLFVVSAIETFVSYEKGESAKEKLQDMAQKISNIASLQETILEVLQNQRVVMREEIKRGFLENDINIFKSYAATFREALDYSPELRQRQVDKLLLDAGPLAHKIGDAGLPAIPAYLSAIALLNALHHVHGSQPVDFVSANTAHRERLLAMRDDQRVGSLYALARETNAKGGAEVLTRIDRWFPLGEVVSLNANQVICSHLYGVVYRGFDNKGAPILEDHTEPDDPHPGAQNQPGRYNFPSLIWNTAAGKVYPDVNRLYSNDYNTIPELDGNPHRYFNLDRDPKKGFVFPSAVQADYQQQVNGISTFYQNISASIAQGNLRDLVARGVEYVDRILARKQAQMNATQQGPADFVPPPQRGPL